MGERVVLSAPVWDDGIGEGGASRAVEASVPQRGDGAVWREGREIASLLEGAALLVRANGPGLISLALMCLSLSRCGVPLGGAGAQKETAGW